MTKYLLMDDKVISTTDSTAVNVGWRALTQLWIFCWKPGERVLSLKVNGLFVLCLVVCKLGTVVAGIGAPAGCVMGSGQLHPCWVMCCSSNECTHRSRAGIEVQLLCCACECFWLYFACMAGVSVDVHSLSGLPAGWGSPVGAIAVATAWFLPE